MGRGDGVGRGSNGIEGVKSDHYAASRESRAVQDWAKWSAVQTSSVFMIASRGANQSEAYILG